MMHMENRNRKTGNLIVFDMDGVIVDVSGSYREVIQRTAARFFQNARHADRLPDPLFSFSDLASIKQGGGWNNDWDLTHRVISLLLDRVDLPEIPEDMSWDLYRQVMRESDVSKLAHYLQETDDPLARLHQKHPGVTHPFADRCYQKDIGSGNIIRQMFQEMYLGSELFESIYQKPAQVYLGPGYIFQEELLLPAEFIQKLAEENTLCIATGRPFTEAFFTLNRFGIHNYFSRMATLDDCLMAENWVAETEFRQVSLSKPNPYMLNAIAADMENQSDSRYYIGDMPDDMEAASRSDYAYTAVGCLLSSAGSDGLKQKLVEAGAHSVIESVQELECLINA